MPIRKVLASKPGKLLKRSLKKAVFYLPESVKFPLIRTIIRYKSEISTDVVIKVADSLDEIEAALQVLTEAYLEQGFLSARRDFTEINKYQLLPMSTIIVAKYKGKVVGTLTLVKQNPLGLPMQRVFQISDLMNANEKVAEITCLAIDRRFRRDAGTDLLFPLMKFMYHYAIDYFDVKKIFVACFPREADFYKSLLQFQNINGMCFTEDYLGAPAMGLYLDLATAPDVYRRVYTKAPLSRNLYHYFTQMQSDQLVFPDRRFIKTSDSIWSARTLKEFLDLKPTFRLPTLSEAETLYFQHFYAGEGKLHALFPSRDLHIENRKHRRFENQNQIQQYCPKSQKFLKKDDLHLIDVSLMGLCISSPDHFDSEKVYAFSVQVSEDHWSQVKAKPAWNESGTSTGFQILEADSSWTDYVHFLEQTPSPRSKPKAS